MKLTYCAIVDPHEHSGVYKKIRGFCNAWRKKGHIVVTNFIPSGTYSSFWYSYLITKSDGEVVYLRSNSYFSFLLLPSILLLRLKKKYVILEYATPMSSVKSEILSGNGSLVNKTIKLIGWCLSGPWIGWSVNNIVAFSYDSKWFRFLNDNKTIYMGNGIDVDDYFCVKRAENINHGVMRLIGVANLADWHGYDRVLRAIKLNNGSGTNGRIYFHVIGDGPARQDLLNLTDELEINEFVTFHGQMVMQNYVKLFQSCQLAVGSVGLDRKNIEYCADLKAREYCAFGIPFLTQGKDFDFDVDLKFRYVISFEDPIRDIIEVFEDFKTREFSQAMQIHQYAVKHLDWGVKVDNIINRIKK